MKRIQKKIFSWAIILFKCLKFYDVNIIFFRKKMLVQVSDNIYLLLIGKIFTSTKTHNIF